MNNLQEVKAFLENGSVPAVVEVLNPYANLNDGLYSCDDTIVAIVAGDKFGGVYKARSYQDVLNVIDNMEEWLITNPFLKVFEHLKQKQWHLLPTYEEQVWNPDPDYITRRNYSLSPVIVIDPDYPADVDEIPRVFVNLPKIGSFYHWNEGTWLCNNRCVDNLHELLGRSPDRPRHDSYSTNDIIALVEYYLSQA